MRDRSTDRRMLIHIGYHKAASTTLQQHVFANDHSGFARWRDDRKLVAPYFVCHSTFTGVPDHARIQLQQSADEAKRAGKCFVVSHERLSGYFATGGFDSEAIARRLAGAFPAARILIVVREQTAMLESFYSQYVSDGGVLPFRKFMRLSSTQLRRSPEFDLSYLCYDRLVECYQTLFGSGQVLVLPFELLRADAPEFVRRIAEHCETRMDLASFTGGLPRMNERHPVVLQGLVRLLNRFKRTQLNPGGLLENLPVRAISRLLAPAFDALTPEFVSCAIARARQRHIAHLTNGYYAQSNARLQALTGLDLRQWGYAPHVISPSVASDVPQMPRAGGALVTLPQC